MTHEEIQAGFASRWPWVTGFTIGVTRYGGRYEAMRDTRPLQFARAFPDVRRVLELGSMEGGHSLTLASIPSVTEVVAVDGRLENHDRARFVHSLYDEHKITLIQANLETADPTTWGQFDACFCCGVLYHLPAPWELLTKLATVTERLFVWTHVCGDTAETEESGYAGRWYTEAGFADVLSGLSPRSFWPTRAALLQMLADAGWHSVQILDTDERNPHGPCLTFTARSGGHPA